MAPQAGCDGAGLPAPASSGRGSRAALRLTRGVAISLATAISTTTTTAAGFPSVVAGGKGGFAALGVKGFEFSVVVGVAGIDRDFLLNELFDIDEKLVFLGRAVGNGVTGGSGASGPSDPVHVGFRFVREIHVDDEGDVLDIDSTGRDVGGDKDGEVSFFELGEGAVALRLGAVAVNRFGFETVRVDRLTELVGSMFGAGEDDGEAFALLVGEVLQEQIFFGVFVDEADRLVDFLGRCFFGCDRDRGRVDQDGMGQFLDRPGEGGGEEEGLSFAGEGGDNFFDVAEEAHVEHAIDLVEDEILDAREIDVAFVHVVEEAAGAGHEDIDPGLHRSDLGIFTNAAEDEGLFEAEVATVALKALRDLGGKFPGRGQDEHAGGFSLGSMGIFVQGIEDGEREGRCFSGAGLGDAKEIASFEKKGDRLGLDGRGRGVILLNKSTLEGSCQSKLLE